MRQQLRIIQRRVQRNVHLVRKIEVVQRALYQQQLPLGQPALLRWPRERYALLARMDTSGGDRATLSLRDGEREWPVGVVRGPVRRVFWLDAPELTREGRRALVRAFDEASLYGEQSRIVLAPRQRAQSTVAPASRRARRSAVTRASAL